MDALILDLEAASARQASREAPAQTRALRDAGQAAPARRRSADGALVTVISTELCRGDVVIVAAGEVVPTDGEIIEGVASLDESAITGESAPVLREAGGDRSGVTGGTRVLSDQTTVRVTADRGDTFLDRMIGLVEGARRRKPPNEIAEAALLASLADTTVEGRSVVELCERRGFRGELPAGAVPVEFSARTRLSGVDLPGGFLLRKGASAIERWLAERGQKLPRQVRETVDMLAAGGRTPLVVAGEHRALDVILLSDVLEPNIRERIARLRAMGLRVVMITGDNLLTAAAIARQAGVGDFVGAATPGTSSRISVAKKKAARRHDGGRRERRAGPGSGRHRGGHELGHAGREGGGEYGRSRQRSGEAHSGDRDRQTALDDARRADDVLDRQ